MASTGSATARSTAERRRSPVHAPALCTTSMTLGLLNALEHDVLLYVYRCSGSHFSQSWMRKSFIDCYGRLSPARRSQQFAAVNETVPLEPIEPGAAKAASAYPSTTSKLQQASSWADNLVTQGRTGGRALCAMMVGYVLCASSR